MSEAPSPVDIDAAIAAVGVFAGELRASGVSARILQHAFLFNAAACAKVNNCPGADAFAQVAGHVYGLLDQALLNAILGTQAAEKD